MLSPLHRQSKGSKLLTTKDYPQLKHDFITTYGYLAWEKMDLSEFFELLPQMNKTIAKKEAMRIATLKHYGVKNPK